MEDIRNEVGNQVSIEEQEIVQASKTVTNEVKMFTQEELNKIVQDRLARERSKYEKDIESSNKEQDINAREKELNTRILKLDAINTLKEKGLPIEILELLSFNSKEELDSKIDLYHTIFSTLVKAEVDRRIPSIEPQGVTVQTSAYDTSDKALREAMKLLK